jgi:hypothetical protein
MLKSAFAAAGLAAALSLGATVDRAAALPGATPSQLGLAAADMGLVQNAAVACGRWGCRRIVRGPGRVWVGPRRPLYGFAGPRASWGWSNPNWNWSGGPSWGWSNSWGWNRPGLGWNRPGWNTWNRW